MSDLGHATEMLSFWTALPPRAGAEAVAEALDGVARSTNRVLVERLRRRARELEGVVVAPSDVLNELAAELEAIG